MTLKYKLLDHPFYQDWSCGKITTEQLSKYAVSYHGFIKEIPNYWQKVVLGLNAMNDEAFDVIVDEHSHISLWEEFSSKLPKVTDYPVMNDVLDAFNSMTPSELLGAIHAFEIQQPEVAKTKKAGLLEYYGYSPEEVKYFDAHLDEQEHIIFGTLLMHTSADKNEFNQGFEKGSVLLYNSLDLFL